METANHEQHPAKHLSLQSHHLQQGLEVRIDVRLACLAAALTAPSSPGTPEHSLVSMARKYLKQSTAHPSVHWLSEQVERVWLLGADLLRSIRITICVGPK